MNSPSSTRETATPSSAAPHPLSTARIVRAFTGALMAGTFALLFYKLLTAVSASLASNPVTSDNVTVINLSAAVRTLVLGTIALGAGVFAMAALGLGLLGLQMIGQRLTGAKSPTPASESEE